MTNHVKIIAEIGVNHNGQLKLALEHVDAACEAGADTVKFQTFDADRLASIHSKKAKYQENKNLEETQYQMLKKLELTKNMHREIFLYCKKKKIECISSGFDIADINFLLDLGQTVFKVPSGEIINIPYLRHLSEKAQSIILSTGMATIEEIKKSLSLLTAGKLTMDDITILHCTSQYPAPFNELNLNVLKSFKEIFGLNVGYSDHSLGIDAAIASVALGATVIEKHFTLDKSLPGPDHKASIDPQELTQMVRSIRNIEIALGEKEKKPTKSELLNLSVVRQFIVAKNEIKKSEVFSTHNLTSQRTGEGISVKYWDDIIGKQAHKNFRVNEVITDEE